MKLEPVLKERGEKMFEFDPFLFSPPPPNTLTNTEAVLGGGERGEQRGRSLLMIIS